MVLLPVHGRKDPYTCVRSKTAVWHIALAQSPSIVHMIYKIASTFFTEITGNPGFIYSKLMQEFLVE